jgi:hypothetical protein
MNCLRRAGDFDPPGGNGRGNSFQFHHLLGVADATAGNSSHPCRPHSQALPDPSDFRPAPARNANHARGPCCAALARTARTSSSLSSSTSDSTHPQRCPATLSRCETAPPAPAHLARAAQRRAGRPQAYYFDEELFEWVPLPSVMHAPGIVAANTTHFSTVCASARRERWPRGAALRPCRQRSHGSANVLL